MKFPTPKALILDRDGTIIEHVPYLHEVTKVRLLPDVKVALSFALEKNVLLFLHTNQSGVGRKFFELSDVHECNDCMIDLLGLGKSPFARICIAPEAPDQPSLYRKPSPQFAIEICQQYNLHPSEICYMGDNASDLATAAAAQTNAIGLTTGLHDIKTELAELNLTESYSIFDSLLEACHYLFPN